MNKEYERWIKEDLEDLDLQEELQAMAGNEEVITEHFSKSLSFGTAGLRGILGVGTNRMNRFVVRQTTQGLANYLQTIKGQKVAISYDTRLKSWDFAKDVALVLASNHIHVYLYDNPMPVPSLSFATRYYHCAAGIMLTASHNPACYNGYKVYDASGCQLTDEVAAKVFNEIHKVDIFKDVKRKSFAELVNDGLIEFISDDCKESFYQSILAEQVRPESCIKTDLKIVYSPLNGTGLVPLTTILKRIGMKNIYLVKEQAYPNGYFSTCTYPNPEKAETMSLGISLAKEKEADLVLETDPDADRVGVAMRLKNGEYQLISGNEMGALLLNYLAKAKQEKGVLAKQSIAVRSIVSSPLADKIANYFGIEMKHTLTGFKWIGDQINKLEAKKQTERFLFGFEESYGYLAGTYVRDKDAIVAGMLICEMAAYYKSIGSSLAEQLSEIYKKYGYYLSEVKSYEFAGLKGMQEMEDIMSSLRNKPLKEICGEQVLKVVDYMQETGLPKANVLSFSLENDGQLMIRPSGTEPKLKLYLTIVAKNKEDAIVKSKQWLKYLEKQLKVN